MLVGDEDKVGLRQLGIVGIHTHRVDVDGMAIVRKHQRAMLDEGNAQLFARWQGEFVTLELLCVAGQADSHEQQGK